MDVNRTLFGGHRVARREGNSLVVDTDILNMATQYSQSQNIVVATVSPVHVIPTYTQANVVVIPVDTTQLRRTESDFPVDTTQLRRSESDIPIATATVIN